MAPRTMLLRSSCGRVLDEVRPAEPACGLLTVVAGFCTMSAGCPSVLARNWRCPVATLRSAYSLTRRLIESSGTRYGLEAARKPCSRDCRVLGSTTAWSTLRNPRLLASGRGTHRQRLVDGAPGPAGTPDSSTRSLSSVWYSACVSCSTVRQSAFVRLHVGAVLRRAGHLDVVGDDDRAAAQPARARGCARGPEGRRPCRGR